MQTPNSLVLKTTTFDYVRSTIRRGTSRIDASSAIVKTKDDRKVKLHVLAVTTRRAKSSQQKIHETSY